MGEKKRFLDRVLRFMGIEEEVAASHDTMDDDEVASLSPSGEQEEPNRHRRRARLVGTGGGSDNSRVRVIVLEPQQFNDVQSIADHLISREPVVLTLDQLDTETSRRVMDFLGGTTYALGGHIQPLGGKRFLLAPSNVEIDTKAALTVDGTQEEHFL